MNIFDVSTDNIGLHIKNIIAEKELSISATEESSVVQLVPFWNRFKKKEIGV